MNFRREEWGPTTTQPEQPSFQSKQINILLPDAYKRKPLEQSDVCLVDSTSCCTVIPAIFARMRQEAV
jgi:hypothetical protein